MKTKKLIGANERDEAKGEHTPTPWHIEPSATESNVLDKDNHSVAIMGNTYPQGAADAAFIVKAVNCHNMLIEGLRKLEALTGPTGEMADQAVCAFVHVLLAKAEGE